MDEGSLNYGDDEEEVRERPNSRTRDVAKRIDD